jgi:hypothetical protein
VVVVVDLSRRTNLPLLTVVVLVVVTPGVVDLWRIRITLTLVVVAVVVVVVGVVVVVVCGVG